MKKTMMLTAALLTLALLTSGCGTTLHFTDDKAQNEIMLRKYIPTGMASSEAVIKMEQAGYKCDIVRDQNKDLGLQDIPTVDLIWCSRKDYDKRDVMLTLDKNDKVSDQVMIHTPERKLVFPKQYVLKADKFYNSGKYTLVLDGNACFQSPVRKITADKIILDIKNKEYRDLRAVGNVKSYYPDGTLASEGTNLQTAISEKKVEWFTQTVKSVAKKMMGPSPDLFLGCHAYFAKNKKWPTKLSQVRDILIEAGRSIKNLDQIQEAQFIKKPDGALDVKFKTPGIENSLNLKQGKEMIK